MRELKIEIDEIAGIKQITLSYKIPAFGRLKKPLGANVVKIARTEDQIEPLIRQGKIELTKMLQATIKEYIIRGGLIRNRKVDDFFLTAFDAEIFTVQDWELDRLHYELMEIKRFINPDDLFP